MRPTPLYLAAGLKLSFMAAKSVARGFEEYVSDSAKPVPYRSRPIDGGSWSRWLVDDQREASGRPDVVAFVSEVLTAPVKISGEPIANLIASTSGTDSDWVVKLIDVFPDQVAGQPAMGGYQLMVSADIFRGRYRESLETPKPSSPARSSSIDTLFRRRTTSSLRATGSWYRSSRAGFRSTTVIRRRLSPTSSGPSQGIIARPHSGSITRRAMISNSRATLNCH